MVPAPVIVRCESSAFNGWKQSPPGVLIIATAVLRILCVKETMRLAGESASKWQPWDLNPHLPDSRGETFAPIKHPGHVKTHTRLNSTTNLQISIPSLYCPCQKLPTFCQLDPLSLPLSPFLPPSSPPNLSLFLFPPSICLLFLPCSPLPPFLPAPTPSSLPSALCQEVLKQIPDVVFSTEIPHCASEPARITSVLRVLPGRESRLK